MTNEDKIVELLSELVQKQDDIVGEITGLRTDVNGLRTDVGGLKEEQKKPMLSYPSMKRYSITHERDLLKIIELLEQDVPRFDEVVKIEQLPEDRFIIRKLPSEKAWLLKVKNIQLPNT